MKNKLLKLSFSLVVITYYLLYTIKYSEQVLYLDDAVKVLDNRQQNNSAIFFTETSKSGIIGTRQVCALESTARIYKDRDIYLLVVHPPHTIDLSVNIALSKVLSQYHNIHVLTLKLNELFKNSPMEEWYRSGVLQKSKYLVLHTSDVIRIFTLWKYGGMYLDLDFILFKKIDTSSNFVVKASTDDLIASSVLSFSKNHDVTESCIQKLVKKFKTKSLLGNGPLLITNVMREQCQVLNITSKNSCNHVSILPTQSFFPVPFPVWRRLFNETATLEFSDVTYGIHVWNKVSADVHVSTNSQAPYAKLAQKYCPIAWRTYVEQEQVASLTTQNSKITKTN